MKEDLKSYPVLREFLGMDSADIDESTLSVLVKSLKERYIDLGLCLSLDFENNDASDIVRDVMDLMAQAYDSLRGLLKEQESNA